LGLQRYILSFNSPNLFSVLLELLLFIIAIQCFVQYFMIFIL
jgi:hypothetical protein